MMNEINQRASTGKIRFLDMVRDRCLSNLTDLEASLNGLIPPPDLLEQRRQMRIKAIEAALSRIEAGDFGYCVICDEAIAPQRLSFDPALAVCVSCSR